MKDNEIKGIIKWMTQTPPKYKGGAVEKVFNTYHYCDDNKINKLLTSILLRGVKTAVDQKMKSPISVIAEYIVKYTTD